MYTLLGVTNEADIKYWVLLMIMLSHDATWAAADKSLQLFPIKPRANLMLKMESLCKKPLEPIFKKFPWQILYIRSLFEVSYILMRLNPQNTHKGLLRGPQTQTKCRLATMWIWENWTFYVMWFGELLDGCCVANSSPPLVHVTHLWAITINPLL